MIKLKLAAYGIGFLGASALLAFGVGYTTSQFRGLVNDADARGYKRGYLQATSDQTEAAREAQEEADKAVETARNSANERARQAEQSAAERIAQYEEALSKARLDPVIQRCDAIPYPDSLWINPTFSGNSNS